MRGLGAKRRMPIELRPSAYANIPLPIGFDKTISQPFIVTLMTDWPPHAFVSFPQVLQMAPTMP